MSTTRYLPGMARLTPEQRLALRDSLHADFSQPGLRADERFVAPTRAARQQYIRFVTAMSRLTDHTHNIPRAPITGAHWKL